MRFTMPTTKRPVEVEGRVECQFAGCNRSFTRHEHLQRHALNHADGDYTCDRCRAHFKRPDLLGTLTLKQHLECVLIYLDRHLTRHRQKDAEGSELMTRKRAWKDAEGRIVKKRPNIDSASNVLSIEASQNENPGLPPSPPRSASSQLTASPNQQVDPIQHYSCDFERTGNETSLTQPYVFEDANAQDLFWESNSFLTDPINATGPFDDIFMPDTASSFNMPYTTMTNYNWLFDLSLETDLQPDLSINNIQSTQSRSLDLPSDNEPVARSSDQGEVAPGIPATQYMDCEKVVTGSFHQSSRRLPQETPMSMMEPNGHLPMLNDPTRERILDIIELCRPSLPDGTFLQPFLFQSHFHGYTLACQRFVKSVLTISVSRISGPDRSPSALNCVSAIVPRSFLYSFQHSIPIDPPANFRYLKRRTHPAACSHLIGSNIR